MLYCKHFVYDMERPITHHNKYIWGKLHVKINNKMPISFNKPDELET